VSRADVPAEHRAQVGDAVDAAGVALLADDQDRQDQRDRLRDDGEVHAAHAPLEHREADDEGERAGTTTTAQARRQLNGTASRTTAAR
jgi:hypothetical protein